jgi:nicotinate-nucleotide adenylyltransferase
LNAIGIFGGTFDPVHIGHLRTCIELCDYLGLDEINLVPCARPPHREQPLVTPAHRWAMLGLAVENEPLLRADDRELRRQGPSYTINTVQDLRAEMGPDRRLYLCIGMDSLVGLQSWSHWQEIANFCHLVVVARPGWEVPKCGPVADWLRDKIAADVATLGCAPAGRVLVKEMTLLPISSTQLRVDLAHGRSVRYLLPDRVLDYIKRHSLYQKDNA